jgi:hypothetical protein
MGESRRFQHKDYEMLCTAKVIDHGRFAPALVISKQVWPTRPREIAVRSGDYYATEEHAIDAAYAQGIEWIRDYG